jgi:hypothetical protein
LEERPNIKKIENVVNALELLEYKLSYYGPIIPINPIYSGRRKLIKSKAEPLCSILNAFELSVVGLITAARLEVIKSCKLSNQ